MNVLVIDDDSTILEAMREWIISFGHDVSAVNTCKWAESLLSQIRFDIVIADNNMNDPTGKMGHTILDKCKLIDKTIITVLMTAYPVDYIDFTNINFYYQKPINFEKLSNDLFGNSLFTIGKDNMNEQHICKQEEKINMIEKTLTRIETVLAGDEYNRGGMVADVKRLLDSSNKLNTKSDGMGLNLRLINWIGGSFAGATILYIAKLIFT